MNSPHITNAAIAVASCAAVLIAVLSITDDHPIFLVLGLALWAAYFAPSIVALRRHHQQRGAIIVVNVLLGWTFIGWVIALAMACSAVRATA